MIIDKLKKPVLPLKENKLSELCISDKYIIEALGLFPKQNYLVALLSEKAIDMLNNNVTNIEVKYDEITHLKGVFLTVEVMDKFSYDAKTRAEFWGIKEDKMVIKVIISNYDRLALSSLELKNRIASCLTHEINHGYVMLSKYYNSGVLEFQPENYEKYLSIYRDDSLDEMSRNIAYLLYSTYRFEIQAMVPQIYQELKGYFDKTGKEINLNNFKNVLKNTNTYWTFYSGLHYDLPQIIAYLEDQENCSKVINDFKIHGLNIDKGWLLKNLKDVEKIYTAALKDISRCAMAYYYDLRA